MRSSEQGETECKHRRSHFWKGGRRITQKTCTTTPSFLPSFLVPLYNSHVQRRNRFNSGDNLPGFFSLPRFCSLSSECGGRRCSSGPMKSRWSTDTDEKTKMPASSSIKSAALALHYFPVRTESIDVIFTSKLRQIIITV